MDGKTAYINRKLLEDVYMVEPKGLKHVKYLNRVCKLKRFVYVLKQAP